MRFHKLTTTTLGLGYIPKGAGTAAAAVTCLAWCWVYPYLRHPQLSLIIATIVIMIVGTWSAGKVEVLWGKDNRRVVIDEVLGMCISLWFIPFGWPWILAAFVLFRFFDIAKPLFIRRMEYFPGGWGVMLDDVLAGIYANFVLQLFIFFQH
jgi:phosphatidylglycerophosphatase A